MVFVCVMRLVFVFACLSSVSAATDGVNKVLGSWGLGASKSIFIVYAMVRKLLTDAGDIPGCKFRPCAFADGEIDQLLFIFQ